MTSKQLYYIAVFCNEQCIIQRYDSDERSAWCPDRRVVGVVASGSWGPGHPSARRASDGGSDACSDLSRRGSVTAAVACLGMVGAGAPVCLTATHANVPRVGSRRAEKSNRALVPMRHTILQDPCTGDCPSGSVTRSRGVGGRGLLGTPSRGSTLVGLKQCDQLCSLRPAQQGVRRHRE
jgi:hypothetical protein